VLGPLDHVGYLTSDLDGTVEEFRARFALDVVRPVDLPQYSILGLFLGSGSASVEIFTFTDAALLRERLGAERIVLDHAAHEVRDIDAAAAALGAAGVRFCGPDRRNEVTEPIQLGAVRHLWTVPDSACGQSIQLLQR